MKKWNKSNGTITYLTERTFLKYVSEVERSNWWF